MKLTLAKVLSNQYTERIYLPIGSQDQQKIAILVVLDIISEHLETSNHK